MSKQQRGWITRMAKEAAREAEREQDKENANLEIDGRSDLLATVFRLQGTMSQREIAAVVNRDPTVVSRILNGKATTRTTPKGGAPPLLSDGAKRHAAELAAEALMRGEPMKGPQLGELLQTAYTNECLDRGVQPDPAKTFHSWHARKSVESVIGAPLKLKKARSQDDAKLKTTRSQCYGAMMSLKRICERLPKDEWVAPGWTDASRIHAFDETTANTSHGEKDPVERFVSVGGLVPTARRVEPRDHRTSGACFSFDGVLGMSFIISAKVPMVDVRGPPMSPCPAVEMLWTENGSQSTSEIDEDGERAGTLLAIMRAYVKRIELRHGPANVRGVHVMVIDGPAVHFCLLAMEFLRAELVDVYFLPANSTDKLQASDHHSLHGFLSQLRRADDAWALRTNGAVLDVAAHPHILASRNAAAFSTKNIVQAVQATLGVEYKPHSDFKQLRITDASAQNAVDRMEAKGMFDHQLLCQSSARATRSDEVLLLSRALQLKLLPSGTRELISPTTVAAMNWTAEEISGKKRLAVEARKVAKKQKRIAYTGPQLTENPRSGMFHANAELLNQARRDEIARKLKAKEETMARKKVSASKKTAADQIKTERDERVQELVDSLVSADAEGRGERLAAKLLLVKQPQIQRSVARYLSGTALEKFDLTWARAHLLNKKLVQVDE